MTLVFFRRVFPAKEWKKYCTLLWGKGLKLLFRIGSEHDQTFQAAEVMARLPEEAR